MAGRRGSPARNLVALLLAGAVLRGLLIVLTPGEFYDTSSISEAGRVFLHAHLHFYGAGLSDGLRTYAWPYPPGFLPVAAALRWLADHGVLSVNRLDRVFMSLVDLLFAAFMWQALGWLGRSPGQRVAGAALVAIGAPFIAVSAVHGQLDSLAWLPPTGAMVLWLRRSSSWHVVACGALIGIGIVIKTAPGLTLIALALSVRDRRELLRLVGAAAAVVILACAPFALVAPAHLNQIVEYRGSPGRAGLMVLLQPSLALDLMGAGGVGLTPISNFLFFHAAAVLVPVLSLVVAAAWRWRLSPPDTMVALLLGLYVFAPAVLPQYWLWLVAFLVIGGRLRAALAYELALLPLLVLTYGFLNEPGWPRDQLSPGVILHVYIPTLWLVSLGLLGGLGALLGAGRRTRMADIRM